MTIKNIHLPTIDSTSNEAHRLLASGAELPDLTIIEADDQTAGRGQVGNSWETEAGKNIIFSLVCHPVWVHPAQQYVLSESIALAVVKALARQMSDEMAQYLSVKWPNDIYFRDRKISGTLIECDLLGKSVSNCIVGTGVNINQQVFRSDAPNPVSLINILGRETDRTLVLRDIITLFSEYYERIRQGEQPAIHAEYKSRLYRNDGHLYPYSDAQGPFLARITDVEPSGRLLLETADGECRRYEFKEVRFEHK